MFLYILPTTAFGPTLAEKDKYAAPSIVGGRVVSCLYGSILYCLLTDDVVIMSC